MYYYGREKRRRFKRRVKRSLAALAAICIIAISYFVFFNTDSVPDNVVSVTSVKDNSPALNDLGSREEIAGEKVGMQKDSRVTGFQNYGKAGMTKAGEKSQPAVQKLNIDKADNAVTTKQPSHETAYEVVSEAHFYSKPNKAARRKDFIPYWNVSSSIKPIHEKNNFVYVKFKHPLGQTTTGWLRKKDLKKVNTMYENTKD